MVEKWGGRGNVGGNADAGRLGMEGEERGGCLVQGAVRQEEVGGEEQKGDGGGEGWVSMMVGRGSGQEGLGG